MFKAMSCYQFLKSTLALIVLGVSFVLLFQSGIRPLAITIHAQIYTFNMYHQNLVNIWPIRKLWGHGYIWTSKLLSWLEPYGKWKSWQRNRCQFMYLACMAEIKSSLSSIFVRWVCVPKNTILYPTLV